MINRESSPNVSFFFDGKLIVSLNVLSASPNVVIPEIWLPLVANVTPIPVKLSILLLFAFLKLPLKTKLISSFCEILWIFSAITNAISYQWYFNGEMIEGANQSTYIALESGTYWVEFVTEDGHSFQIYFLYTIYSLPKIFSKLLPFMFFLRSMISQLSLNLLMIFYFKYDY